MRRRVLVLPCLLALLAASCDTEDPSPPGNWQPPLATPFSNPSYPVCERSIDCPWGERCDVAATACTTDPGAWTAARDFALPDLNENSATNGQTLTLSAQHGLVTVVYFGSASCSICWQQASRLQGLLERLAVEGTPGVMAMIVNHAEHEIDIPWMARITRLSILQDTPDYATWITFAASKDTFLVIDGNGFLRTRFDPLYIFTETADLEALERAILDAADSRGRRRDVGASRPLGATILAVR